MVYKAGHRVSSFTTRPFTAVRKTHSARQSKQKTEFQLQNWKSILLFTKIKFWKILKILFFLFFIIIIFIIYLFSLDRKYSSMYVVCRPEWETTLNDERRKIFLLFFLCIYLFFIYLLSNTRLFSGRRALFFCIIFTLMHATHQPILLVSSARSNPIPNHWKRGRLKANIEFEPGTSGFIAQCINHQAIAFQRFL